ncbi:MAG: acyltransferase [Lachnospiraceae bacterium]|nr:acyltransferase [Lachnospiraceae bacterium]
MSNTERNCDNQTASLYQKQNPWVSLLRIIMCFIVVCDHFEPTSNTIAENFVIQYGNIAVPCFMFLSFYFMGDDIKKNRTDKIKNRILRLYIPIFVWNIIYFGCKNIIFVVLGNPTEIIGINSLIEGLLFTHVLGLANQLWFLFSQIIILIVIVIFLSYAKNDKYQNVMLIFLIAIALFIEYSGVNNNLFGSAAYSVRYPLGRSIECLPYAAAGLLYSWHLKDKNILIKICLLVASTLLAVISRVYVPTQEGFGYSDLFLLFSSTAICILTFSLPDLFKGGLRIALNYIGSCTMGIYCTHNLVGWMIQSVRSHIPLLEKTLPIDTLLFDTIVFALCLLFTTLIRCINHKLKWKWLKYTM